MGQHNDASPRRPGVLHNLRRIFGATPTVHVDMDKDDTKSPGDVYSMTSNNTNKAEADATRNQGHTHCHPFHRPMVSLWHQSTKDTWRQHTHGDVILNNIDQMVRGKRMPGELVDRLNGPCGTGQTCQFFSPTTGYYFDVDKKAWVPFRQAPYNSRDERKAANACDTTDDDSDQSQANKKVMAEQMHCSHTRVCMGGVYHKERDRCMCLTTQDKTYGDAEDHHTGNENDHHYSHKSDLPPLHRMINWTLLLGALVMVIVFALTLWSYLRHTAYHNKFLQLHMHANSRPRGPAATL